MDITEKERLLLETVQQGKDYVKIAEDFSTEVLVEHIIQAILPLYQNRPISVTLTAGPASGKTTLMKVLLEKLQKLGHPSSVIVTEDYNSTTREERDKRIRSGESPVALKDFDQLRNDVERIRSGEEVDLPLYDPITGSGIDRGILPHHLKQPLHFLFIEGDFQPISDPDFTIYYFIDSEVRKQNRMIRDVKERAAKSKEAVEKSFDERQQQFSGYTLPHLLKAAMVIVAEVKKDKGTDEHYFVYKHAVYSKRTS